MNGFVGWLKICGSNYPFDVTFRAKNSWVLGKIGVREFERDFGYAGVKQSF